MSVSVPPGIEAAAPIVVPILGLLLLLAARTYLGRWPDLWRARRTVLPLVARIGSGDSPTEDIAGLENLDELVPEKTAMELLPREYVGRVEEPPATVRDRLRNEPRIYPATLASVQYTMRGDARVWEVGSYARRPQGFLGRKQFHARLTPADGGAATDVWAHYELNPWRKPVDHYNSVGWSAQPGVENYQSLLKVLFGEAFVLRDVPNTDGGD